MTTAAEILSIGEGEALRLFPGPKKQIRTRYHALVREWHADVNKDPMASAVIAHINVLHDIATGERLPSGPSAAPRPARSWVLADGGEIRVKPRSVHAGALGDVIVTERTVAYETVTGYEDVADAEAAAVGDFKFADGKMRADMERFLPKLRRRVAAVGKSVNVFDRPSDTVLLADLVAHMGGRMPAVHVAWLVSCLENIACYLAWNGLCHGAISAETVLVCPEKHSVILVGGWGFATPFGKRPAAVPQRTLSLIPRLFVKGETVDPSVDLALIRETAQEALGTSGGGGLSGVADLPEAMRRWLCLPPLADAFQDYASWSDCLTESFGPRKFVRLDVKPDEVYRNNR